MAPLDHRPRKEQRQEPQAGPPATSLPGPKSTPSHQPAPGKVPAPWEARIAALEARLGDIQALCDRLLDIPRQLDRIQRSLDQQASLAPAPTSSSPLLHQAAGSSPASVASSVNPEQLSDLSAPVAAVVMLNKRADAQESLLDRMCSQIDQLTHYIQAIAHHGSISLPGRMDLSSTQQSDTAALPAARSAARL